MAFSHLNNMAFSVEKQSPGIISKATFPLRYGAYSEIRTSEYEFIFNLNGEIKFIRGLNVNWPHPAEQLKRTDGNDWVFYSVGDVGGDKGIISWMGEYYLPCPPYPSNAVWEINYFANPGVMNAFAAWSQLYADLYGAQGSSGLHSKTKALISQVLQNHDALAAGSELICFTASEAFNAFYSGNSRAITPFLFLFGSVDSLLNSKNDLFEQLGQLPFYTYINIGFESVDASTLKFIGKPVDASKVRAAFQKMIEISDSHTNIEITGNFLVGEQLSSEHYKSLAGLLRDTPGPSNGKGAIYLSPLKDSPKRRELLPRFYEIKSQSQLPVYIYLIQRL